MNLFNLISKKGKFVSLLEKAGYTAQSVKYYKRELDWLINSNKDEWKNYKDALESRLKFVDYKNKNFIVGLYNRLYEFDVNGGFIARHKKHKDQLISKQIASYKKLSEYYKKIVDDYKEIKQKNVSKNTIESNVHNISSFLLYFQNLGIFNLKDIEEENVISYFFEEDGKEIRGYTVSTNISSFCTIMANKYAELKKIIGYIPKIKKRRKNLDYLKNDEIKAIKTVLRNHDILSRRDRAIVTLMLYTGIRVSDAVNLKIYNINWASQEISFVQQKTKVKLSIPFVDVVGNAIIDYIENERPDNSDQDYIFLSSHNNGARLETTAVNVIVNKVFKSAGIRQYKGARRGCHLFRHNFVITNTNKNTKSAIITAVLGHESANSINAYLNADIENLRTCALAIEMFPVSEEIFNV